jgi:hypothetical protein
VWAIDVYPTGTVPPSVAVIVIMFSSVGLVIAIILGFVRGHRRIQLAVSAEASVGTVPPPFVEGRDVVLRGIVRHHEDHDVAVKVSVTQTGSEAESSGSWSHSWTEIDREIMLAPFLLELSDGRRALVEPPRNVDVADALDQKVWIDRNRRVLSAELVPGETIFARGRLERSDRVAATSAYRDVEWGWALRPSGGQMLLSSEPLGEGLRARAAFHRRAAWIALAFLVAIQLSLAGFYGRAMGTTRTVTAAGTHTYETTDSDNDTTQHFAIDMKGGGAIEVDSSDYVRVGPGTTLPARFGSGNNWSLGAYPTLGWLHSALIAVTASGVWLWYRGRRRSTRPWFRRKVNDRGSGQLPDPPPA